MTNFVHPSGRRCQRWSTESFFNRASRWTARALDPSNKQPRKHTQRSTPIVLRMTHSKKHVTHPFFQKYTKSLCWSLSLYEMSKPLIIDYRYSIDITMQYIDIRCPNNLSYLFILSALVHSTNFSKLSCFSPTKTDSHALCLGSGPVWPIDFQFFPMSSLPKGILRWTKDVTRLGMVLKAH